MDAMPTLANHLGSAAAPALLNVSELCKRYGDQMALANVSFDVRPGEILGLIGPNGAGKTTLLEAVAGLIPIDAGRVCWREAALSGAQRREVMFYLPDGLRPWDDQFVIRVIEFVAGVFRSKETEVAQIVRNLALSSVLGKRVLALSKGYARRLMLALALITPRPLLLMDEPFDGFDLRQTRNIMALLRGLAADGRTFVLAIHQLTDAERVCDRFVLLADGKTRGAGTLDDLRARTRMPSGNLEDVFLALT
jgi:ABC-type multidrug transport system ATPase subunit